MLITIPQRNLGYFYFKHKNFKPMWNIISNFAEKIAGTIAGIIYYLETKNKTKCAKTKKNTVGM